MAKYLVAALYKFATFSDFETFQAPLLAACRKNDVMGTLLLAAEGINGTISGPKIGVRNVLKFLRQDQRFADLVHKESWSDDPPFHRMKVRLKREIVTMGVPGLDPSKTVGQYVEPQDWNQLISRDDVLLIDTRNDYEVDIGTFKGAINPATRSFRDLPDWIENQLSGANTTKIVMFCTGGIRCEKSTAYLRSLGYQDVYHLKGGILEYLEQITPQDSLWQGECFVFDQRVSVGHGLKPGPYDLCHACRHPISKDDMASPHYVKGVACPRCHDSQSPAQTKRYADRQHQMELAKSRNQKHIAADIPDAKRRKTAQKQLARQRSTDRASSM